MTNIMQYQTIPKCCVTHIALQFRLGNLLKQFFILVNKMFFKPIANTRPNQFHAGLASNISNNSSLRNFIQLEKSDVCNYLQSPK